MPPRTSKGLLKRHRAELISAGVLLALPWAIKTQAHLDESAVWLIDIFTATLMVSVAILKGHFDEAAEEICRHEEPITHIGNSIVGVLARTGGERYEHALSVIEEACHVLDDIEHGVLPLRPRDYYDRIEMAINSAAPKSQVWAVSSADPFQWQADEFQHHWLDSYRSIRKQKYFNISSGLQ